MAYGFNPASLFMPEEPALPQFLTPEELQQQAITERFNAGRAGGFVPAMMGALDYMRTAMPAQAPTPRTVSGGSVIGLMPEQTNALLNRVNEANMLDQRMFEARQGEMRADSRAREGRILSAREAQARRQQELEIEKQRMDMQARKEAEERARPTVETLPGQPGFGVRKSIGPDGNPMAEIIRLQGSEMIPTDPAKPVRGVPINGKLVNPYTGDVIADLPAEQEIIKPPSTSEQLEMMESLSKTELDDKTRQDVFNDWAVTRKLPFMNFIDKKDPKKTIVTVKNPDGSTTLKIVNTDDIPEQGIQTSPAKKTDPKSAINLIQDAFEVKKLSEAPRKQAMDLLDRLGFDASWINKLADEQGMMDDNSRIPFYGGAQYYLPSQATNQPVGPPAPARQVGPDGVEYEFID